MDLVFMYLQVLSDSGTACTLPLRWPEERGEIALSSLRKTGNTLEKGRGSGGGALVASAAV